MKVLHFEDQQEWLEARKAKITGSKLKGIVTLRGSTKKKGYYQLIADRMMHTMPVEDPRERGHRLEQEAIDAFTEKTGFKVETNLVMWIRDDSDHIAISPDGVIDKKTAIEVKCLDGAGHVEALLTQEVPNEYKFQVYQYFIVNDDLETLYFALYNPQMISNKLFYITVKRKDVEEEIGIYKEYQERTLKEIEEIVTQLTF